MKNEKYAQDLKEIRNLMNRSSRFISLSGLSGVFAGIYAIIGAGIAHWILRQYETDYLTAKILPQNFDLPVIEFQLFLLAIAILILAIGTAILLTTRKAKRNRQKIWDATSKRLLSNFFIPLIAGGIFCLVLVQYRLIGLIPSSMLIFYGMALIHASKYTFADLKSLGYANLVLGLIATQFIGYGLYFWAAGFGIFHIVYGLWMHKKYDRTIAE